jgi:RNA-directed DNA polymerase
VWVPRRDHGSRPVADVPFLERALLECLTELLRSTVAPYREELCLGSLGAPAEGERGEFELAPLGDPGDVIVVTDISSFYEYVDHGLLEREILELTGDVDLSVAIRQALGEITQRDIGIPQGPRSSDVLADLYLSAVDRVGARAGLKLHRFNDDFAFAARSDSEAERKLVELENALRGRALTLNHSKTRVVSRDVYESWLEALDERLRGAAVAVASTGFYGLTPSNFRQSRSATTTPRLSRPRFSAHSSPTSRIRTA